MLLLLLACRGCLLSLPAVTHLLSRIMRRKLRVMGRLASRRCLPSSRWMGSDAKLK